MKQFALTLGGQDVNLPLAHHHLVQSMIYALLRADERYSGQLHSMGFTAGGRKFKLFTFSSLRGHKTVGAGRITFKNDVFLDIRSISDAFCDKLTTGLRRAGSLSLGANPLTLRACKTSAPVIKTSGMDIRMLSPLTVHMTEEGRTTYFTPLDAEFSRYVNQNFHNKYKAYFGHAPDGDIELETISAGLKDKYVTRFKSTMITAWRGTYRLSGKAEHLNFLYYTGLGAKNSAGFGMFEPVKVVEDHKP